MATHEYKRYWQGTVHPSDGTKTITIPEFSVPAGEKLKQFKVTNSYNYGSGTLPLQGAMASVGWDRWTSDTSKISWTNGSTSKVYVKNVTSSAKSVTITITFQTEDLPYTAVVKGEKIKASDLNQVSGKSVSAGNLIRSSDIDGEISAGTKITASDFNTKVLGL